MIPRMARSTHPHLRAQRHTAARAFSLPSSSTTVMAGLDPAIHVLTALRVARTWMAGTRPAMTIMNAVHQQ
jgi:hypothetical protein